MLKLINGRGRLGDILRLKIDQYNTPEDIYIYHTWKVEDKTEESQKKEFYKLKEFVDKNKENKIIFVSTASRNETFYAYYKQLAESYILLESKKSLVIKLPLIISQNSIFTKFKNEDILPYGIIEFISLDDAAESVLSMVNNKGLNRVRIIDGNKVKASYIKEIVRL